MNWGDTKDLAHHEYTVNYLGEGSPVNLKIKDWYDNDLENNYCHLPVCIIPKGLSTPEFPSPYLPIIAIIGFLGGVLLVQRPRNQ